MTLAKTVTALGRGIGSWPFDVCDPGVTVGNTVTAGWFCQFFLTKLIGGATFSTKGLPEKGFETCSFHQQRDHAPVDAVFPRLNPDEVVNAQR